MIIVRGWWIHRGRYTTFSTSVYLKVPIIKSERKLSSCTKICNKEVHSIMTGDDSYTLQAK